MDVDEPQEWKPLLLGCAEQMACGCCATCGCVCQLSQQVGQAKEER